MSLKEQQLAFFNKISTSGTTHLAADEERLRVYQNNYFASLMSNLRDIYPSIVLLLGDEGFSFLAKLFFEAQAPNSGKMIYLGKGFPGFLASQEHLHELAYIEDVARLDWAHHQSYYQASLPAATAEDLQTIPPAKLASYQINLQPSLQCIESSFAIFDLWQMHFNEAGHDQLLIECAQDVVIYQKELEIELALVDNAIVRFIDLLQRNISLGNAIDKTLENCDDFEPSSALAFLLGEQLITDVTPHS